MIKLTFKVLNENKLFNDLNLKKFKNLKAYLILIYLYYNLEYSMIKKRDHFETNAYN